MKYKIFFLLFCVFVLLYLYISQLNPDNVRLYIGYGKFYETSVADFVVISFVLGIVVSIVINFFYDIKQTISVWRSERKEKKKEEFRELFEKAKSYDLRGDREKAIEVLNRIIRRAPDIEESYMLLSDMYSSMREFDKALEVLGSAEANLGKRESVLMKKVKIGFATKDLRNVEAELKEILQMNESNIEALSLLRDLYIMRNQWGEAFEVEKRLRRYIKTEEEKKTWIGIRYEKAREVFNSKEKAHFDTIIKELKDILNEDKRFIPAYILLAEIYKQTNKLNDAGRVYGRGYSKTGHIIFLLKMENLYIERGDPGVILKIYRRILDISPKDHLISFLYARLCLRLEMIDEAIDMLNILFAEGEDFKGLHRAMAEAAIHRGEIEKALEEFRLAFPIEQIYVPFICNNCKSIHGEWSEFCNNCKSWNTINVKKEDFLRAESTEPRVLYETEDWEQEGYA